MKVKKKKNVNAKYRFWVSLSQEFNQQYITKTWCVIFKTMSQDNDDDIIIQIFTSTVVHELCQREEGGHQKDYFCLSFFMPLKINNTNILIRLIRKFQILTDT